MWCIGRLPQTDHESFRSNKLNWHCKSETIRDYGCEWKIARLTLFWKEYFCESKTRTEYASNEYDEAANIFVQDITGPATPTSLPAASLSGASNVNKFWGKLRTRDDDMKQLMESLLQQKRVPKRDLCICGFYCQCFFKLSTILKNVYVWNIMYYSTLFVHNNWHLYPRCQ